MILYHAIIFFIKPRLFISINQPGYDNFANFVVY